jgi:hypothetical protein
MADVSASPFGFRDFFQQILPAVFALTLFVPFHPRLAVSVTVPGLIFTGIVVGYLIFGVSLDVSKWMSKGLPWFGGEIEKQTESRSWVSDNWDFLALHTYLTKDENETIDAVNSLSIFYRITAFYLFSYAFFNVGFLVAGLWMHKSTPESRSIWDAVWQTSTPMFGGWGAPTIGVVILSLALMTIALHDSLEQYGRLYAAGGIYDQFSAKYQGEMKPIAKRVWGLVLQNDQPLAGVSVRLVRNGVPVDTARTDATGRFAFKRTPQECAGYIVRIEDPRYEPDTQDLRVESPIITLRATTQVAPPPDTR